MLSTTFETKKVPLGDINWFYWVILGLFLKKLFPHPKTDVGEKYFKKPVKGLLASLVVGMINCWFGMGPGMNISNPAAAGISSITFRITDQRTFNVRPPSK